HLQGALRCDELARNVYRSPRELLIGYALGFCALISILTTLGIAAVLLFESANFFAEVSIIDFLTQTEWTPPFSEKSYGIWPLLSGTMLVTVIAALVAIPIGLMSAIFIAEYAPDGARRGLKPGLALR